jgi:phosphoribosyl-ATP pyrophosphohydrolase/phosphoribosyl-AMP cyclohydrolase
MNIKYNEDGLVPVIAQDVYTKEVLMLAYMNEEALEKTLNSKEAYYYSRSRQELWKKGETSGNIQFVKELSYDCDQDTILLKVEQKGVACHTNHYSCFYRSEFREEAKASDTLQSLFALIKERKELRPEGSYTTYLFDKGVDKILKKVAEETGEVLIATKNNNEELIYESADLLYHLLVLFANQSLELSDVLLELEKRKK